MQRLAETVTAIAADSRFRDDATGERETDRDGEGAEEERRARGKEDDQSRGGEIRTRDFCLPKAAL